MRFRSSSIRIAAVCLALALVAARSYADPTTADDIAADPGRPLFAPWTANELATPEHAWSARFSTIFLQRDRPAATSFLINTNTGEPIVNPHNFLFAFAPGADIGLVRSGEAYDLDLRYFGVYQGNALQGPFNAGPGTGFAGAGGGSPDSATITSSDVFSLNSAEANLRRDLTASCSLLAGFRYVSFRDRMSAIGVDTVTPDVTHVRIDGNNNLYGLQVGIQTLMWSDGKSCRVEGTFKAGILANTATSGFRLDDTSGNIIAATASRTREAFVGDVNFTAVNQLNDHWAIRAGYQLLWLSGVATASEQVSQFNFNSGELTTNLSHSLFLYGATLGLEFAW